MKISKKRHLEMAVEAIPKHPKPKIDLEQYSTPSTIAADLMWNAYSLKDIENGNIIDLGCGTGIFTFSSLFLGAKSATGIDIDPSSIKLAKKIVNEIGVSNANFIVKDIHDIDCESNDPSYTEFGTEFGTAFNTSFDTAITNPPFGSQSRAKKGADRKFMELAMKLANVRYSFHMAETREFVIDYYEKLGGNVTHEFLYTFPLDNIYDFHKKESKDIEVIVVRVE